jgi:hypothetical protein
MFLALIKRHTPTFALLYLSISNLVLSRVVRVTSISNSVTRLGEILLFGYFLPNHLLRFELNRHLSVDVLDFQFEL